LSLRLGSWDGLVGLALTMAWTRRGLGTPTVHTPRTITSTAITTTRPKDMATPEARTTAFLTAVAMEASTVAEAITSRRISGT
jgi:hypothetical protein